MSLRVKAAATRTANEIMARVPALPRLIIPAITIACLTSCSDDPVKPMVPAPVASVVVTPELQPVFIGAPLQLIATTRDAEGNVLTGRAIAWATSDADAATVSTTGLVTAVGEGGVTITAMSEGKIGSAQVIAVIIPVVSVDLTPMTVTIKPGSTERLTAKPLSNTGFPLPGRVVTWSSSDESRARVSATGLVTAVAVGTATITAASEGRTATAQVTVVPD